MVMEVDKVADEVADVDVDKVADMVVKITNEDFGLPAYSHPPYSHQVGICHNE